jgi:exonuclease SbcC
LIEAQKLVDEFNETDYSQEIEKSNDLIEVQDDLMVVESEALDVLDIKSTKVSKLIKELSNELSGAITCPSCTHEFTLDCKHGTLEQVKEKFTKANQITKAIENKESTHEATIEKINNRISNLRKDLDNVGDKRELERVAKNDLVKSLNEVNNEALLLNKNILRVQSLINEHNADIKDCKNDIKKFDLVIDGFKQEINNIGKLTQTSNIESLRSDLLKLNSLLAQFNVKLNDKGDEIYKRNQWANNFKQFRMHLANQSLEAIEFHMNRYLDGMDSDLKVKMEGFKMLANGTFKDEITAKIIRNVERSFNSFSGGERGRLLFAAILANRHMLNSTHKYGGLDFLSIDEVFEGVDSLGLKKLVQSAKQLDIAVMIITHVTDEEVNDDILLIEKINGISYVKTKE